MKPTELSALDQRVEKTLGFSHPNISKKLEMLWAAMEKEKIILAEKLTNTNKPLKTLGGISRTSLDFLANPHRI